MREKKSNLNYFVNHLDAYAATVCFFVIMILLTVQVVSRYVFSKSITWSEEAASLLFVWMTYFGVSAATYSRKHLSIEFVLNIVSFKAKRALLILDDLIFAAFNVLFLVPLYSIIVRLGSSTTTLLKVPKRIVYAIIPLMLILTTVRLAQDIRKLLHENEKTLGASKPALDLDACEREYQASKEKKERKGAEE